MEEETTKKCIGPCQRILPRTRDNFPVSRNRDGLSNKCKECTRVWAQERRLIRAGVLEGEIRKRGRPPKIPYTGPNYYCNACRQSYPPEYFDPMDAYRDHSGKLRRKCMACAIKSQGSRPIPKSTTAPDGCAACGTNNGNLRGDIELSTGYRYGILCSRCHALVVAAKGDSERVAQVARYLVRTRTSSPPRAQEERAATQTGNSP